MSLFSLSHIECVSNMLLYTKAESVSYVPTSSYPKKNYVIRFSCSHVYVYPLIFHTFSVTLLFSMKYLNYATSSSCLCFVSSNLWYFHVFSKGYPLFLPQSGQIMITYYISIRAEPFLNKSQYNKKCIKIKISNEIIIIKEKAHEYIWHSIKRKLTSTIVCYLYHL